MRFKPSLGSTLILLAFALLFARLGLWQMDREVEKQLLFDDFEQAPLMALEQALGQTDGFSRVEVFGSFDPDRHVLLDNKILNGQAGVHVYSPFLLESGLSILVNRGWLPMPPDRRSLPPVLTEPGKHTISGLLKKPLMDGHRLGDPDVLVSDKWPQLVTYFDLDSIGTAMGRPLAPWILQLDADDPTGFEGRQWQAAVMTPEVHRAYAFQWFSLMLATLIIWVAITVRRGKKNQI